MIRNEIKCKTERCVYLQQGTDRAYCSRFGRFIDDNTDTAPCIDERVSAIDFEED